jgi:beta-N-acetylhexosaminidase
MDAISRRMDPGTSAARAIEAGNDVVTKPRDAAAAVAGIKAAVERGDIAMAELDASVRRLLTTKARLGLHKVRTVSLDQVPAVVGGRRHQAVAEQLGQKSITLLRDDRNQVPLRVPPDASVLYLSILDYPSGWRVAIPSATFLPELRKRWTNVTAIELSDRSSPGELDVVRGIAGRYDAIVASVFVRTASGSGKMDLAAPLGVLLEDLARATAGTTRPFITVFFGNPYVPMSVPSLPAMMLTYDFYELAEASAVRALAGEAPISGLLPITLPGLFERRHGLTR